MSLTLLVVIVVVGIAAVVLAVHMTGGSSRAVLQDADAAVRRFQEDFPDARIDHVLLTADGSAAFLRIVPGRIGVVQAVGGRFLTRMVSTADLASRPRATGSEITVRFRDFTWPGGCFTFSGEESAKAVEELFLTQRKAGRWEAR